MRTEVNKERDYFSDLQSLGVEKLKKICLCLMFITICILKSAVENISGVHKLKILELRQVSFVENWKRVNEMNYFSPYSDKSEGWGGG